MEEHKDEADRKALGRQMLSAGTCVTNLTTHTHNPRARWDWLLGECFTRPLTGCSKTSSELDALMPTSRMRTARQSATTFTQQSHPEQSHGPTPGVLTVPGLMWVTRENGEAKCRADPIRASPGRGRPRTLHVRHLTTVAPTTLVLRPRTQEEP